MSRTLQKFKCPIITRWKKLEDDGIIVVEADLIRDMVVTEIGTWLGGAQMNVIRHDPEKLVTNLVEIFKNHTRLKDKIKEK